MRQALILALNAYYMKEIPIGAIVVQNNKIIGSAYNKKEQMQNPIFHAEVLAINQACMTLKQWRLNKCTIYVTLQPCQMCFFAIMNARISNIVYAALSNDYSTLFTYFNNKSKIDFMQIKSKIMINESIRLLQYFFKGLR
jgi:tRNA(adenine34) deaminase